MSTAENDYKQIYRENLLYKFLTKPVHPL